MLCTVHSAGVQYTPTVYLGIVPSLSSILLASSRAPRHTRYSWGSWGRTPSSCVLNYLDIVSFHRDIVFELTWISCPSMNKSSSLTARCKVASVSFSFACTCGRVGEFS